MTSVPPIVLVAGMLAIVLGLPLSLYALLTRSQRRATRDIRAAALRCGWRYRPRRWQGNPTAFRIDGRTKSGSDWTLNASGAGSNNSGWNAELNLSVPILGGEVDFAVFPRAKRTVGSQLGGSEVPLRSDSLLARVSSTLAGAAEFLGRAQRLPSGSPAFDAAYEILVSSAQFQQTPIDAVLGNRLLRWPEGTIAPNSVVAWRDRFGLHFEARLPGPANWATVAYFLAVAEDLCAKLPAPMVPTRGPTLLDKLMNRWLSA